MKQRILVVDDEAGLTWIIKLTLEQTGRYEVRTENLGIKAIEAPREFKPDLILLDVLMPGMLGSEIAEQLEQDPELRAVKVVFLTAVVSKEDVQWAHGQIGGHEFIAKPLGAEELCRFVESKLGPVAGLAADGEHDAHEVSFARVRNLTQLEARLRDAGKPVMLDIYADWCVSSKEMQTITFTDAQVKTKLGAMLLLQADVTANIGERDFRTIALAPKTRELARVVAAMNNLSGKIRRLIEDESARAEKLQQEAYRDPVTGLYNRRGLERNLQGLFRAERDVFSGVFALLALEGFKEYNLRRGFHRADELLALVAQTITTACAGGAVVCSRFGGASFAVAAVNMDPSAAAVLVASISASVESAIAAQALTGEIQFHCGAAHFDSGAPPLPELLAAADLALTRAQVKGLNTFDLIALSEIDRRGRGSLAWREQIEGAIVAGKFALYTQPVLSLPGRTLMQNLMTDGSQALMRAYSSMSLDL